MARQGSDTVWRGQTNFYVYVGSDPVNRIDPKGLQNAATYEMGMQAIARELQAGFNAAIEIGKGFVGAYAIGAGAATDTTIAPLACGVARAATAMCYANPFSCASAASNIIDFFDGIAPAFGGPTTGLPSITPGGYTGSILGEVIQRSR